VASRVGENIFNSVGQQIRMTGSLVRLAIIDLQECNRETVPVYLEANHFSWKFDGLAAHQFPSLPVIPNSRCK
jgi:hypothetical protein